MLSYNILFHYVQMLKFVEYGAIETIIHVKWAYFIDVNAYLMVELHDPDTN